MCNRILFFLVAIISVQSLIAQDYLYINAIQFSDNKLTKDKVILRELTFNVGDSILITDLPTVIQENETRLKGIGLFNSVKINPQNIRKNQTDIFIDLNENWYIFPAPIFELADRNFNVWWQEQGRSFKRINYGVRLRHYNLTGNKDPLKLVFQGGYTRKLETEYAFPYIKENSNLGVYASIFYADNKEIPYITTGNKSQFYKDDDERIMLKRFRASIQARLRPDVFQHHALSLEFHRNSVDDIVLQELNPNYFLNGKTSLKFFMINYDYQYDKRDYALYPQKGYRFFGNIKKEGLGIFKEQNALLIQSGIEAFMLIIDQLSIGSKLTGKTNLVRNQQAFANNTGLGWSNEIVSGYELYVMDGLDHVILESHIKQRIFEKEFTLRKPKFLPSQLKKLNIAIHLRFNFDFAYAHEPTYIEGNNLNNRIIYGFGPALDIILYNSYLYSIEYSFNDIGERGLFFKVSNSF